MKTQTISDKSSAYHHTTITSKVLL